MNATDSANNTRQEKIRKGRSILNKKNIPSHLKKYPNSLKSTFMFIFKSEFNENLHEMHVSYNEFAKKYNQTIGYKKISSIMNGKTSPDYVFIEFMASRIKMPTGALLLFSRGMSELRNHRIAERNGESEKSKAHSRQLRAISTFLNHLSKVIVESQYFGSHELYKAWSAKFRALAPDLGAVMSDDPDNNAS